MSEGRPTSQREGYGLTVAYALFAGFVAISVLYGLQRATSHGLTSPYETYDKLKSDLLIMVDAIISAFAGSRFSAAVGSSSHGAVAAVCTGLMFPIIVFLTAVLISPYHHPLHPDAIQWGALFAIASIMFCVALVAAAAGMFCFNELLRAMRHISSK